jgi:poly(3-hydroxybutyrate) depolymerase
LAKYLQAEYELDPDRTFVAGFSSGGFTSYTLACEASSVFKGAAAVAALMNSVLYASCNPSTPVPFLHIHGHGTDRHEVHYYEIENFDHLWPGGPVDKAGYVHNSGIEATRIIWDLFSKY